ncbi:MAG: FkbM family methyltransferase [Anaerolineae bacterium]|nr:FkbM family methyltransferase [Phycisphaerae bacterium]
MSFTERVLKLYSRIAPTERGGYRLARAARKTRPRDAWRSTFHTPDGFDIDLDLSDYPDICMAYGLYELDTARLIKRLLKPGDHFVDCGANIGYFTLMAAQCVAASGKVDAFEPQAANFQRLSENLRRNNLLDPVRLHAMALSDREGTVELFRPTENVDNHGTSSMFPDPEWQSRAAGTDAVATTTQVRTARLDEVLAGSKPKLIKIDVEGAEPLVASGMSGLLSGDSPPKIILEFNPPKAAVAGFDSTEAVKRLLDVRPDYQIYTVGWRLKRVMIGELKRFSQINVLVTT